MSKSRRIGYGDRSRVWYEALEPHKCATCGGVIGTGERFTRSMMIGGGAGRTYPKCERCVFGDGGSTVGATPAPAPTPLSDAAAVFLPHRRPR